MNDILADKLAIRELVENWVLYRDAGDWERFATVWHPDGWMTATWFQGPATDFIEASRKLFDAGGNILHTLGGWTCDIVGNRAISQVKMTINQRAPLDGVLVDVVCFGRFYDFLEKRDGRWGIVRRQPIYEKDRLDPVLQPGFVPLEFLSLGNGCDRISWFFVILFFKLLFQQSLVFHPLIFLQNDIVRLCFG